MGFANTIDELSLSGLPVIIVKSSDCLILIDKKEELQLALFRSSFGENLFVDRVSCFSFMLPS